MFRLLKAWALSINWWNILWYAIGAPPDREPEPDFWAELHADHKRQTDEWDQEFFRQTGKGVGALDPMLREQEPPSLVQGAFNTVLAPGLYQSLLGAQPANAQQQALMQGALANQRQLSYEQMLQASQQQDAYNHRYAGLLQQSINSQLGAPRPIAGIDFPLDILGNPWRQ